MNRQGTLFKMNIKLLLRKKMLLFFLLAAPLLSAFVLNLKFEIEIAGYGEENLRDHIIEMEESDHAVYMGDNTAFIIKVYDASKTELSEYVLGQLTKSGMFSVCRLDAGMRTKEEIEEAVKKDAFDDRAGAILYLKEDFDTCILEENYEGAMEIFDVSDDERKELFLEELQYVFVGIRRAKEISVQMGNDGAENITTILESMEEQMPEKRIITVDGKDKVALTGEQSTQKSQIGWAMAIITLGFLFCGVFVAHTVIEEQNNRVYTRILLTKMDEKGYLLSKFLVTIVIAVLQTAVLGIFIFAVKSMDFGIPKISFLLLIFCLGLIFSTLAFLLGILLGDVMSANYAVFTVWSVSALLAGLYFPMDGTSQTIKTLSALMPQNWFMKVTELLLTGDKGAYSMLLYITVAYLVVIVSVGAVGLKVNGGEPAAIA